jgi:hypothetical protein
MATIKLPAELEMYLKQLIKEQKEAIIKFKKPKHKEPSLSDAIYYMLKEHKMRRAYINELQKINFDDETQKEQFTHLMNKISEITK